MTFRRFITYAGYPLLFGGGTAAVVALVGNGVSYWQVGPPVLLAVGLLVWALERWHPHAHAWQTDQGDTLTDALHFAGNVVANQLSAALYGGIAAVTNGGLRLWPVEAPFALQFLLGAALLDLGLYAVHRASHVVPWLWRLHAIHHSSRRVYWLNGQRRHILHELIEGLPGLVALGLLGAPATVVACFMAAITLHLFFQHGNIEYRLGPFTRVFAVAELHRWHHLRLYADVQGNYGAILSIWDFALGTDLPKKGDAPLDVGMDDEPDLPPDYLGQLGWPFRRRRVTLPVTPR